MKNLLYKLTGLLFWLPINNRTWLGTVAKLRLKYAPPTWHIVEIFWDEIDYERGEAHDGQQEAHDQLDFLVRERGVPSRTLRVQHGDYKGMWVLLHFSTWEDRVTAF